MERGPPCSGTADDLWQRRTNQRAARQKLIALRRAERIADSFEALWHRTDLSDARIGYLRRVRREQYCAATEIDIDERQPVSQLLEQIAETGDMTVAEAIRMAKQQLVEVVSNSDVDHFTG
ncbi:MAG: hypothetical protein KDA93_01585 [Planctomycetaceae bacterium]|nr:hypothetical protein [Planctomycetaceae bacterium]